MSQNKEKGHTRWVSLADRLNPNRAAFDPEFKAKWRTLSKEERKRIIGEDQHAIQTLKDRGTESLSSHQFQADPDDHCETSPSAYAHVEPLLSRLAKKMHKPASDLKIYDPYYCAGAVKRHLGELGFPKVHNEPDDFYQVIAHKKIPTHDVIVTNPPYSGNHFEKLLDFLKENGKPFLLLLPQHFGQNICYANADWLQGNVFYVTPPERYHYWTPEGLRPSQKRGHCNLVLGNRNSPFPSFWFVSLAPVISKRKLFKKPPTLPNGGRIHSSLEDAESVSPTFNNDSGEDNTGLESSQNEEGRPQKKKKPKQTK